MEPVNGCKWCKWYGCGNLRFESLVLGWFVGFWFWLFFFGKNINSWNASSIGNCILILCWILLHVIYKLCRELKQRDELKGLWLEKFQVSWVTCLGVNSVRVWFEKLGSVALAVLKLQFSLCISHCISGQKSSWGVRMLCSKSELRNFLTTT